MPAAEPSRAFLSEGQSAGLPANINLILCSLEHWKQSKFLLFCFVFSSFIFKEEKMKTYELKKVTKYTKCSPKNKLILF